MSVRVLKTQCFSINKLKRSVCYDVVKRSICYDVVIVGGGVMGSSSAYFLKTKEPSLKVAVIEKDSTYSIASSALSVASIRQQFSCKENIQLSQWSRGFMRQISETLKIDCQDKPDIQLQESSYMFLSSSDLGHEIIKHNNAVQQKCSANTQVLSCEELHERFPWLNTDNLTAGSICNDQNEGWFDGWLLLQSFRKKAEHIGVEYIKGECTDLDICSEVNSVRKISSKNCSSSKIHCKNLVNAAGPWSGQLMENNNIYLPVTPRKRYVYVIDCPKGPGRQMPLTVDPSGVYCRPEGSGTLYLTGRSPCEVDEPDPSNLEVDYDYFYEFIWPILAKRFSGMEELKLRHSWSGYYEYNTFDQNGIIGPHTEISNLFFATGFTGHGIQQSPAVGNAISELILDGKYTAIDLRNLGYSRIAENRPLLEINIV